MKRIAMLAVTLALGLPGLLRAQEAPTGFDAIRIELDAAWKRNDQVAIEQGLRQAFEVDARRACDFCFGVIVNGSAAIRPVGAAVLARYADAPSLAATARALNRVDYRDERRLFVRMLGRHAKVDGVYELAADFLEDQDMMVRASAITALASTGKPEAVGLILRALDIPPAYSASYGGRERDIVNMAAYGAVHALTDLEPQRSSEVIDWWKSLNGAPPPAPTAVRPTPDTLEAFVREMKPVEGRWRGRPFFATPSFHAQVLVRGMEPFPTTGSPDWRSFALLAEEGMAYAHDMFEPITGPVILPPVRLLICDDQNYVSNAGTTFFAGDSTGNQVVIRAGTMSMMRPVMAHECVHILHTALFREQPRWMLEGLAMSLVGSVNGSSWTSARVRELGIATLVERGVFSDILNWVSTGSSDAREGERYAASYLVVDTLRFGGFAAPDTRLAFLMGRLARHEAPRQAVEAVYGVSTGELDRLAREWVMGR